MSIIGLFALAPLIIAALGFVAASIWFYYKAAKNETGRIKNIVIGTLFLLIPVMGYVFLYIFGRILTG